MMKEICDACACGQDVKKCKRDIKSTIIDGCGRKMTYCSRYNEVLNNE